MAETASYTKHRTTVKDQIQPNPSKFYNANFLCKGFLIIIFLVILPLFPSQAPEFINQTLLTRSWELLHLLFVGIAVSYGLFSRRNDDSQKENNHSKFDNAQSYVSRFLQVSSVFDEENENLSGCDENKVQTWSNQYYRNDPVVVLEEQRATSFRKGEKPLLLPVRSLKSRVLDADVSETSRESNLSSSCISRSNSNLGSKRFSSNSSKDKSGDLGGLDYGNVEKKGSENVVLPSPIPWRSRSGRMEVKEDIINCSRLHTQLSPMAETGFDRLESGSIKPQTSRSSQPISTSSSMKISLSPSSSKKLSPSLSMESQGKTAEDSVRKKSFYRSSPAPPPPPPPPPPPFMVNKSVERLSMGNSTRTVKPSDSAIAGRKYRDDEDEFSGIAEERMKETNQSARKTVRFSQTSYKTEELNPGFIPNKKFMEFPEEENQEFLEKATMETDDDLVTEDDDEEDEDNEDDTRASYFASRMVGSSSNQEERGSKNVSDGGPDVDKKADEFIAKFREQIRLQRIESIKRSSDQISKKSLR